MASNAATLNGSLAVHASTSIDLSWATVAVDSIFDKVKNATRPARALAP